MIPSEPRRPRTADLLRAAAIIWRNNWKYALIIAGLFIFPPMLISFFVPEHFYAAFLSLQNKMLDMLTTGNMDVFLNAPEYGDAMIYSLLTSGIPMLFLPLADGAYTHIALLGVQGKAVTLSGILEVSLQRFGKYLVSTLVLVLLLIPASFLFFIPALVLGVYFAFFANAVALSGAFGFGALKLSRDAVRGRWFQAFGFLLVLGLLGQIGQLVLSFMIGMTGLSSIPLVGTALYAAGSSLLGVLSIAQALWFFDRLNRLTADSPADDTSEADEK